MPKKMIRTLIAAILSIVVLLQSGSALACAALMEMQASTSASRACCADDCSQVPEKPSGMPDDACCFKRGSLLAKAAIPELMQTSRFIATVPKLAFFEILAPGADGHAVQPRPVLRPPLTQPQLQIFLI